MRNRDQSGIWSGVAVAMTLGSFLGCNALWSYTRVGQSFPYAVGVDLLAGSGVALFFLGWALRCGWLSHLDLGLAWVGRGGSTRLLGLVAVLAFVSWRFVAGWPVPALRQATWVDYALWFVLLLGASLAELLVFLGVVFCLTARWLRHQGLGRGAATTLAMLAAAALFGLFHYTYLTRWHASVVPMMGVMLVGLVLFASTRDFFLTLLLHTGSAAAGFTCQQLNARDPLDPAWFLSDGGLAFNLIAFVVPFLVLLTLGWLASFPRYRPCAGVVLSTERAARHT